MRRSIRIVARVCGPLAVVCASAFLLLEVTARLYLFGPRGLDPVLVNSVHGLSQTGFVRPSDEPRLGFELRPDVEGYFQLVPFRTNSRGLRDREYPIEKPPDTVRVAVVGSSFALPTGVAIEDAFHSVLEEQLSRDFAPYRYEFINFAVGMYNAEQMLATYELRAQAYRPDLAIFTVTSLLEPWIQFDPSSERRSRGSEDLGSGVRFEKTYPVLQSFLLRLVRSRTGTGPEVPGFPVGSVERLFIELLARTRAALGEPDARYSLPPRALASGLSANEAAGAAGSVLDRLAVLQRQTRIPVVVVRIGIEPAPGALAGSRLEQNVRARRLHYFDTRGAFAGVDPRDFWIHPLDPHPDAHAHAIFAREIGAFLIANGLLPRP